MKVCCLFLLILGPFWCYGFLPRKLTEGSVSTKSHRDITKPGCRRAIDDYIVRFKNKKSSEDFFESDPTGKEKMEMAIEILTEHVADTQEQKRHIAYIHCNADQIELAHRSVKSCKNSLIDLKDDIEAIREKMGECLYTVQSFYSNTNWVELKGGIQYPEFGNGILMDVATTVEDTCKDIQIGDDCRNNIIVQDKLTSGFFDGRGNIKPAKPLGSSTGKCSHGGLLDSSNKMIAKCGINKDTDVEEFSPHYHLHRSAYLAALEATKSFLIANGTGVLDILGTELFEKLFHIKARVNSSLAFAIDYTSSMSPEISGVKEYVIELLTGVVGSENEPANYILSMFHDPVEMNYVFKDEDGYKMIHQVQEIKTVSGNNPDCPEMAVDGMLKAVNEMLDNSPLLVFTDADAKDEIKRDLLIEKAVAKNITINSFISSQCKTRRSSEKGRKKRSKSFFESIAEATGGIFFETNEHDTANVLQSFLKDKFPSKENVIDWFEWSSTDIKEKTVYIDTTMSVLKITIFGLVSLDDVKMFYSNGVEETFTNGKSIRVKTNTGGSIFSIQKPLPGLMKIIRLSSSPVKVNITAQSSLSVSAKLYEQSTTGTLTRVIGSPIQAVNYIFEATVRNLGKNGTLESLSFNHITDDIRLSENCSMVHSDFDVACVVNTTIDDKAFQLQLFGFDQYGHYFSRILPTVYVPTAVKLIIESTNDMAVISKDIRVKYNVLNLGAETDLYAAHIETSPGLYVKGSSSYRHNITSGQSDNGTFVLTATKLGIVSYTLAVKRAVTAMNMQTVTNKIVVSNVERPICTLRNTTGICKDTSLNTAQCSRHKWEAFAEATFSGVLIDEIIADQDVEINHKSLTNILSGPLEIQIRGDCCSPSVVVSVIDVDNYITQCTIDFAGGQAVKSVTMIVLTDDNISSTMVGVIVLVSLTFVLVCVFLLYQMSLNARKINPVYIYTEKIDVVGKPTFHKDILKRKEH